YFKSVLIISDYERVVVILAIRIVLGTSVVCLATISNAINMAVFARQGLDSSMNLTFFSLSACNLVSALLILWMNVNASLVLFGGNLPAGLNDVVYLTGGWPTACIFRTASWITAYITAERCACVAFPLTVKRVITPFRTAGALATLAAVNVAALAPVYASAYFDRKFNAETNSTSVVLAFGSNRDFNEGVAFILHACLIATSLVLLAAFTCALIGQLERSSRWRKDTSFNVKQVETMSVKQKRTIALVIVVACVMIACYSPLVTLSVVEIFVDDFRESGTYGNIYKISWAASFVLGAVSSSVNILFYYKMSSRYRDAFRELF
ncbi:unnamed protein product, partial [Lymnaea stagnalis]